MKLYLPLLALFLLGFVAAMLIFDKLLQPNTYLLAFNEDHAHIFKTFQSRGDCLVVLENLQQQNYKLQCWSIPQNENQQ